MRRIAKEVARPQTGVPPGTAGRQKTVTGLSAVCVPAAGRLAHSSPDGSLSRSHGKSRKVTEAESRVETLLLHIHSTDSDMLGLDSS